MTDLAPFDLLVFSDDWGRAPSAPQHLIAPLVAGRKVLWVEPAGLRRPGLRLQDWTRAAQKLRGFVGGRPDRSPPWLPTPDGLHRFVPPVLPAYGLPVVRALNDRMMILAVRREMARLGLTRPVLLTTIPTMAGVVGRLSERAAVYLRMDDYSLWPGYDHAAIAEREAALLGAIDLLITPSRRLAEVPRAPAEVALLPHGVDEAHFRAAPGPDPLAHLPRPRVLVSGRLDARLDKELLRGLVDPRWQLILLGEDRGLEQVPRGPGVHAFPAVPYAQLPRWLHAADVLVAPYALSPLGHSLAPLKLRELLATGRPVVCTAVRGVTEDPELAPFVTFADRPEAMRQAVAAALAGHRAPIPALADQSWAHRASALSDLLAGLLTSATP